MSQYVKNKKKSARCEAQAETGSSKRSNMFRKSKNHEEYVKKKQKKTAHCEAQAKTRPSEC